MNWKKYCEQENWHEAACLFPMISKADLEILADSIKQHGLQNPVVLYEGKVLDGRNRLMANDRCRADVPRVASGRRNHAGPVGAGREPRPSPA